MQPPRRLASAALWAVLLCAVTGCGPDLYETVVGFATPTAAIESGNPDLVRQIRKIERTRGLASQLAQPPREDSSNAAFALSESYSDALHLRLTPLVETLLKPDADPEERSTFVEFNRQLIEKTAAAVDLDSCRFDVGHRYGFFARMRYLDDAKEASRLLQLRALVTAASGDSAAVLEDLLRSLQVAEWLSKARRVEARVLGATLRTETLRLAAALIEATKLRKFECEQLYGALRDQLADWPSDSRMLIGERATVIHSYEAIRAGMLDKLVTLEERTELTKAGRMKLLQAASPETINEDQLVYLETMDKLIAAADQPHAPRQRQIGVALSDLSQRPSLFARSLFIKDLPDALWFVSADRAMNEAWAIALASGGRLRLPPFRESPLSGLPYRVESDERRVTVFYGEASDQRVSLPVMMAL